MRKLLCMLLIFTLALLQTSLAESCELVLAGEAYNPDIIESFLRENPEVEIAYSERDAPEDWVTDAITHSNEVDVYFLYTLLSTTFESLKNRGYLLALDDADFLSYADAIYPEIMGALKVEDGICALPFALSIQTGIGVDMDVWLDLGLREEDLPQTWSDFLSFILNDAPNLLEQEDGLSLFAQGIDASEMLQTIENIYASYRAKNGYEIGYATPEFKEILNLFEQIDPDRFTEIGDRSIFISGYIPDPTSDDRNTRYLPLSFKENEEAVIPAGLLLMAVNPNTKHREAALGLVKHYFNHLEPLDRVTLCPDENAPVENDDYADFAREYEDTMANFAQRIDAAADAEERNALIQERDAYDSQTSALLEARYLASPYGIAKFRSEVSNRLAPLFCPSLSLEEIRAVNDKRVQFLEGRISAEQYINELERRYVFSVLEDQ